MDALDQQVLRCRKGDLSAFEDIIQHCEPKVRAVIASMTPDHGAVPDLCQEVFLIAYRKLDTYEPGTNFIAWIKSIARNVAQNERRKWYRRESMKERYQEEAEAERRIAEQVDELVESLPEEALEALRDCVGGLPGKTQAIVDGYYKEGCSLQEVSRILELSHTAAKTALHRARQAIGKCMRNKGEA